MSLTPQTTYIALLVVQTAHLLHHRLAKRHISFAESHPVGDANFGHSFATT